MATNENYKALTEQKVLSSAKTNTVEKEKDLGHNHQQ